MSLTLLICAYRHGLADFNANAPRDDDGANAYAQVSYVPPMEAILSFDGAASSMEEAQLALDLAEEDLRDGSTDIAAVLVRAARLFVREVCVA